MKTAVIAGASGLVGSALLPMLLQSEEYDKIISLGRNTLPFEHPKLQQIQTNFSDLDALTLQCDDVFCCLGTTIRTAGSKEQFKKVDHDFPLELAKAALKNGAKSYTIITAIASDENSRWFYSQVKGKLENELKTLGFKNLNILRPSMLLGPRKEFRLGEWISKKIMILLSWLIPVKYKAVNDHTVAKCMLHSANQNQHGFFILENADILKFNT